MADDKKKKPAEETHGSNLFVDAIFWFMLVLVIYATIKGAFSGLGFSFDVLPTLSSIFSAIFNQVQVFSIFLSLLFIVGIIYYNIKLGELMHHHGHGHDDHGHTTSHAGAHAPVTMEHTPDKRWQSIQDRLHSHNESDWRLAIIESDIVLSDMLGQMGYMGNTIADKLKMADKNDFKTINDAWEAHKVRNRIAHDGAAFKLPQHEAERIVGLYQKVFNEFHFI
ncbi:MAG: protein of unknown function with transrane region [Candidatus Taylorbacteria bacterium]|nr:protein of unknown function with transrane region [Candidatus Taylorbacteria bacterium]